MSAPETETAPWTITRLLAWTQDYLRRQRIESPRLCAELLLAHALQCERLRLYTRFEEVPPAPALDMFRDLVKQAAAGRPIAYLTGTKEFFSLPFEVTADVLIPRPETEILVERTISLARKSSGTAWKVLDLGTGSGCIAVSLAKQLPELRVAASDISEAALAVARRNAERHGVSGRIEFRCGNLFEPWQTPLAGEPAPGAARFDVLVCNPPYVSTNDPALAANVREFEPHTALFAGADGLDVIRALVAAAPAALVPSGHLLVEIAYNQAAAVRGLLEAGAWDSIVAYRDAAGHERVVHARRGRTE